MKSFLNKFKAFLRNHIWADFLLTFIVFFLLDYFLRTSGREKPISQVLLYAGLNSLILTPIFRYFRKEKNGFDPYDTVDNVRHYQVGQRAQIKTYLESKGFMVDYNNGAISYFKTDEGSVFSNQQTFIHETDHWIALVAAPEILEDVPSSINSIYPKTIG